LITIEKEPILVAISVCLGLDAFIIFITITVHRLVSSKKDKNKPVSQTSQYKKEGKRIIA
jgi:hypothetical protein